jgi:hypothetical protein
LNFKEAALLKANQTKHSFHSRGILDRQVFSKNSYIYGRTTFHYIMVSEIRNVCQAALSQELFYKVNVNKRFFLPQTVNDNLTIVIYQNGEWEFI